MTQMSIAAMAPPKMWVHIPVADPRAAALLDRHYSRQSHGSDGVLAPGHRFLLWHDDGANGHALWGVVRNVFRDVVRWRNTIFRNESSTRSSDLIRGATAETVSLWQRRYRELPTEDLITEIDIDVTAKRRSKHHQPGHCYAMAGWIFVRIIPAGHGRSAKAIYKAPRPVAADVDLCTFAHCLHGIPGDGFASRTMVECCRCKHRQHIKVGA